jgi:hypothetical protein
MNTLISQFSYLWNNYFNYVDYSNQDIAPGSIITTKNNSNLYTVIGSNADNNLICALHPNYSVTTIISKNDITKVIKSTSNLNTNKKVTFTYN